MINFQYSRASTVADAVRQMTAAPPAMNFAVGSAAIWRTASATSLAREY